MGHRHATHQPAPVVFVSPGTLSPRRCCDLAGFLGLHARCRAHSPGTELEPRPYIPLACTNFAVEFGRLNGLKRGDFVALEKAEGKVEGEAGQADSAQADSAKAGEIVHKARKQKQRPAWKPSDIRIAATLAALTLPAWVLPESTWAPL